MARLVATLCLLLTAALFSGCASAPEPATEAVPDRMSVAPEEPEQVDLGPTKVVALESFDVAAASGADSVFGVRVPEEALRVRATLEFRPGYVEDLELSMPGCELLRTSFANAGYGTVVLNGECEPQDAGLQQATLSLGAGALVGKLVFEALVPA